MENKRALKPYHGLIGFILVFLMLEFGGIYIYRIFGDYYSLVGTALIPLIGFAVVLASRADIRETVPFKLPPIKMFFSSIGLFIGTMMLSASINVITSQFIPNYAERNEAINEMVRSMSPFMAIMSVAVAPAVCEELFCRGFLQASVKSLKKPWLIILTVGISFGILHRDLYAFIPTALMGAVFALITYKTESLLIPMLLHFVNNAFSVVAAYALNDTLESSADTLASLSVSQLAGYVLFYLGIAFACLFLCGHVFFGKKISGKKLLITLIASSVVSSIGIMTVYVSMFGGAKLDQATYTYGDGEPEYISYELEEGTYIVSADAVAFESLVIVFEKDGEAVITSEPSNMPHISKNVTLEAGKYTVKLKTEDGVLPDRGSAEIAVIIVKQN